MFFYILKRILATIPVMVIVAIFVFLLLRLTPGDPAAILAGDAEGDAPLHVGAAGDAVSEDVEKLIEGL